MLFNSLHFLVFFPTVVAIYFAIPHRYRWIFLLGASYYFYMCWKAEYIILIILSTTIAYITGIQMGKSNGKARKKVFLITSLSSNLGILCLFKYANFFGENVNVVLNHFNILYQIPAFNVLLPVGISFYTFQTLSYSIDVYRGVRKPEYHLGYFAVYVSYFPQLVAGPIERSTRLLPQFFKKVEFHQQRAFDGLGIMLWGFFKKVVIADRLAIYVNEVYNNAGDYQGFPLILATYFFAFQIYCDFSGYSDIAIGSARVMGYELMENFNRPYFSTSIAEFWRRWHISLSSWFRDYLYIPLGGNRVSPWRWYYNLIVVFMICGLWHGAKWTFVLWGALHGFYMIASISTGNLRKTISDFFRLSEFPRFHKLLKIFVTFHLVLFGWVFFRANTISDAFLIIKNAFLVDLSNIAINVPSFHFNILDYLIAFLSIILMESIHLIQTRIPIGRFVSQQPTWLRWSTYYVAMCAIVFFGAFQHSDFIYFQF